MNFPLYSFRSTSFRRTPGASSRCKRSRGIIRVVPASAVLLVAFVAGDLRAQISTPARSPARELSSAEISVFLIAQYSRPSHSQAPGAAKSSVDAIVEKMTAASARRMAELRGFQGKRWYHLQYRGFLGGREASMEVLATYSAPNKRDFAILSESGSHLLLNRVLLKLLDSERRAYENKKQFELTPANYNFELLGTERAPDGRSCYVLSVKPRKTNEFLYSGRIWVDINDFAVVHMEGQPAKTPSFWIRDTHIDSNWEKVGDFWFIAHNSSVSHIRMGGTAVLTIDYGDYQVTGIDRRSAKNQGQGAELPDPASVTPQR
jgi:hypothetical protein